MLAFRFFLIFAALTVTWTGIAHCANTVNSQDTDSQLWSETRLVYNINKQFAVFAAGSYRLTKDFSDFTRASGRIGGTWAPIPAVSIAPSYYYTVADPWTSKPRPENRLCLLMAYRIPVESATLTLSNTTEYRMPENNPNSWWLRPKIKISHPIGPEKWGLGAFAADEIFYNNGRGVFTQDRVFAGLSEKFNSYLTTELYYCRQLQMNSIRPDANVICIDFRISFGQQTSAPAEPDLR